MIGAAHALYGGKWKMRKIVFLLLSVAALLGLYYGLDKPIGDKVEKKVSTIPLIRDVQPKTPLVKFTPTEAVQKNTQVVSVEEKMPAQTESVGEYIDPMNLQTYAEYDEVIEIGEYLDPSAERTNTSAAISTGDYIDPFSPAAIARPDEPARNIGNFRPLGELHTNKFDDGKPVSLGEYRDPAPFQ
jgi:hypothetical protein